MGGEKERSEDSTSEAPSSSSESSDFDSSSLESYSTSLHKNFLIKRKDKVYDEVVEGYFCMPRRTEGLEEAKSKIRSEKVKVEKRQEASIMGGEKERSEDSTSEAPSSSSESSDFDSSSLESYSTSLHKNFLIKRKDKVYNEVVEGYFCMPRRTEGLEEAKSKIRSYTPGLWIEEVGGMKISDYELPKTTTLLLVGPGGSGKSSLVNRISKVFENDKFAPLRAQISYNSPVGEGTYFLQEYMIPRGSTSFCLYDTRSLSENSSENFEMIKNLMTKGVRHGELVTRCFDDSSVRKSMMCKAQQIGCYSSVVRRVDFVIFVVNALSVLQSTGNDHDHKSYKDILANSFSCPYLSFKDDKPVVVVTHGDLLTIYQRALVRIKLGELLGIPPDKQIFDIPGNCDPATELAIVEMLRYSLEHADRNLPCKRWVVDKVLRMLLVMCLACLLLLSLWNTAPSLRTCKNYIFTEDIHIDWYSIRHIW